MLLKDKKIVIIGGTTGIGYAVAIHCFKEGASVVALGKKENESDQDFELNNNHLVLFGDATNELSVEKAITSCLEKFNGFDGLLHVAGGSGRSFGDGPLHEMTTIGWEKTFELNANSVMLSNKAAINQLLQLNKGGSIVNISSVLATNPAPHFFTTHAYAASKAAIIGLTKSAAAFYAKDNIRLNVISPGLIETPMSKRAAENETIMDYVKTKQPLQQGRIGQPSDLIGMIGMLLSDQTTFITGQNILIDGGWSVSEGQY
jgi:NAD(P)-dependent dehydrogenase (short-subunit alcohol dehydrogenase family)